VKGRRRTGSSLFALVALLTLASPAHAQQRRSAYEELQTFSGVLNHILNNYADTISYRQMIRAAIDGVLESLDPHSHFLSHQDDIVLGRLVRGDLAGIGIHIEPVGDDLVIRTLDRNGPADRAGLFPGDRLVAVGDTAVAGLDATQVEARLAGRKGSKVRLRLERGSHLEPGELEVEIERKQIEVSAVEPPILLDSATVYVRVIRFGEEAAQDLRASLGREADRGRRQAILDLRGNPGGLVGEAVEMASLFLPRRAPVFSTRGRVGEVNEDYVTGKDGPLRAVRLVLLIDEGSASAAEALAGALQDLDRAVLVGRRSFGKALIQAPFFLPGGDIVWLTVGRVQTPSGRVIQREYRGLTPDQYRRFAGTGPVAKDTLPLFHTAGGRPVRGGGGISPDVETAGSPAPPAWWSVAHGRGWIQQVVDQAAAERVPEADAVHAWAAAELDHLTLADVLLERVRKELDVRADVEPEVRGWIGRTLAARVAAVRWGMDAEASFRVAVDPDVREALAVFPRWGKILPASDRADGAE
jgi:carboxyl-terminal processing protease